MDIVGSRANQILGHVRIPNAEASIGTFREQKRNRNRELLTKSNSMRRIVMQELKERVGKIVSADRSLDAGEQKQAAKKIHALETNKGAWMGAAKANAEVIKIRNRDLKRANADLEAMKTERTQLKSEINTMRQKLADMVSERDKLSELWRNHLDESLREDDNDWECEARGIL